MEIQLFQNIKTVFNLVINMTVAQSQSILLGLTSWVTFETRSLKKPVNTSPGQRVDGRPKPASIMTVQQKGGRISQGLKGDPFRGDISATLSPTERRTPSHEVPQSKPHRGRCRADRGRGSTATLHIATYNTRTLALQDEPCKEIRRRTQVKDIVDFITKQKWKWAGHAARYQDNRWTLRVTEWQPRHGKRSRGRQVRRWRDDIVKIKGATWSRDAKDRDGWKADAEGYFLQWRDTALHACMPLN